MKMTNVALNALLALTVLAVACNSPQKKHRDGGGSETLHGPDGGDAPDRPSAGLDGSTDADGPGVVVAPPGSVAQGKPCSKDVDCDSGFCRDDVCCESACEGLCNACSMAFTNLDNGKCGPVSAGMDPRGVCKDESVTSQCGQDGTCDGQGACRKQGHEHVCSPASCSADNKFMPAGTCDGKGTCAMPTVMACDSNPCAITGCAKPCTDDSKCPDGNYCANGTCKIKKIAGDACDSASQCGSGNCSPDKVCCDTACTGACTACTEALTGQKNGTCAAVQAGKDPKDDCAADMPKTCGHDGTCDGKGGCRFYDSSVACSDPGCTGSMFSPASACDAKGACGPVTPVDCGQTMCTLNGCKKTCNTDPDCAAGSYCVTMTKSCAPKKANGIGCGGSGECVSGACVDGVCCESACQGKCYACSADKTGQANGRCLPVSGGSDPDTECDSSDQTNCGQDGACDGQGKCRKWATGTQCAAAMCTTDNKYLATRTCDGNGTCAAATPENCGGSVCALSGCKKTCAGNQDCSGNNYCDLATNTCTAQKNVGTTCKLGVECLSQSCVDGVCCESACLSKCYACSADRTGQAAGRCQPISTGTDPDNECDSSDPTTCGQNGSCDGKGQCGKWPAATMCGPATCNSNQFQPARGCDGNGTCAAPPAQDCGGSACTTSGCSSTCADDSGCFGNNYCNLTTHTCAAKKNLATACTVGNECLSSFCAPDGVCCNNACTGKCNACVKEKTGLSTSGTCGAIPAGSDPDNECSPTDATTCGQDGSCDGSGQCRKWASGTQCAAGMCSSNKYTAASTCDGNGMCVTPTAQDCAPNICGAGGCPKTCNTTADCTAGNYCDSGGTKMCAPLKALGAACGGGGECTMGICADGVCCNSSCGNACQACNSQGICSTITGNPHPGHPTCAGVDAGCAGSCMGSADGQCTFPIKSCGVCKNCNAGVCQKVINNSQNDCATMCDANGACLTPALLTLAPRTGSSTSFGTVTIGSTARQTYVVSNTGQQSSSSLTISVSGPEFIRISPGAGDCTDGMALAGGAQCTVQIDFKPMSVGQKQGSLTVSAAIGGSPSSLSLTGTGKQPSGVVTEFDILDVGSGLVGTIVSGMDGNLWFLDLNRPRIFRATTSGVISGFDIPNTGGLQIFFLAAGSDGNMWYSNQSNHSIGRITSQGSVLAEFPLGQHGSFPLYGRDMFRGSDGNMWLLSNDFSIIRMTTAGAITGDFPTTTATGGLRTGPDNQLWFNMQNDMGKIDSSGSVTEMTAISEKPAYWTAGPDGNLWGTFPPAMAGQSGAIGKISPSGSLVTKFPLTTMGAYPGDITAGPDGNLWFTENIYTKTGNFFAVSGHMGRITPSGTIMEFSIPTSSNRTDNIATGSDGNLWFLENVPVSGTSKLAKITP